MTTEGIDYSFARPSPALLVKAGKHFALRYLTGAGKAVTTSEIDSLHAAGLDVGFIYEDGAERAKGGYANGRADALLAKTALAKLGAPNDCVVYFAVDYQVLTLLGQQTVHEYLVGASSVMDAKNIGAYAQYSVVEYLYSKGWNNLWQTYAWSGLKLSSHAKLYQYLNGQNIDGAVDFDRALVDYYGQWRATPMLNITDSTPVDVAYQVGDQIYNVDGSTLVKVSVAGHQTSYYETQLNATGAKYRVLRISTHGQIVAAMMKVADVVITPIAPPVTPPPVVTPPDATSCKPFSDAAYAQGVIDEQTRIKKVLGLV